jgi:hypothetical protein
MLNLFQIEISLGGEALAHDIDLTSQRFIETPVTKKTKKDEQNEPHQKREVTPG